jgi:hypothetical protein
MYVSVQENSALLAKKYFFSIRPEGRERGIGVGEIRGEALEKDILERKGLKGLFFVLA